MFYNDQLRKNIGFNIYLKFKNNIDSRGGNVMIKFFFRSLWII